MVVSESTPINRYIMSVVSESAHPTGTLCSGKRGCTSKQVLYVVVSEAASLNRYFM